MLSFHRFFRQESFAVFDLVFHLLVIRLHRGFPGIVLEIPEVSDRVLCSELRADDIRRRNPDVRRQRDRGERSQVDVLVILRIGRFDRGAVVQGKSYRCRG